MHGDELIVRLTWSMDGALAQPNMHLRPPSGRPMKG
jgi:hypothetical protein